MPLPNATILRTPLEPALYIVATPIGNLEDISLRALRILQSVDVVACEDTRETHKLLSYYGIKASMICYHDFSDASVRDNILNNIVQGRSVALVSDAGTPLISDPGYKLITEAIEKELAVTSIPGPSSAIVALTLSGLPSDRFLFAGFLAPKQAARSKELEELAGIKATIILFESARRLQELLQDIHHVCGDRDIAVVREITKKFEEAVRGKVSELAQYYATEGDPRGEIVVVIGPPSEEVISEDVIDNVIRQSLQTMSVKATAAAVAEMYKLPKKEVYQRALVIAQEKE